MPDKLLQIPKLNSYKINDFTLIFENDFIPIFLNKDKEFSQDVWSQYLEPFCKKETTDFKKQIVIEGIGLLVGFFIKEKVIRFYTHHLGKELFLCYNHQYISEFNNNEELNQLKNHVEKLTSINVLESPTEIELVTQKNNLKDLMNDYPIEVKNKADVLISQLLKSLHLYKPSLFEKLTDFGLGLTAEYSLLRVHLLKFLAILPSLDFDRSGVEVKRIFLESFVRLSTDHQKALAKKLVGNNRALPFSLIALLNTVRYVSYVIPAMPLAFMIRFLVKKMAKRFIAGESIESANQCLKSLSETSRDVTLDQLGELVVSEKEADYYLEKVLELINGFSLHIKRGEKNKADILRAHVSIKVSALCSDFNPEDPDFTYELVAPRLIKILKTAKENRVFIHIDAEHYHYRDLVFKIYKKALLETNELRDFADTGIVIQAYLRDAFEHFCEVLELAKERNLLMPVRLVKGAYWDAETVEAKAHGHNAPQFLNKEETDLHFRQLIIEFLKEGKHIQLCLASHNFSDHCFGEATRELSYPKAPIIEHQCLHMTYEALSLGLASMGHAVRNYVPVGSLLVGMAYLVRRIMENSSQVGVLTMMRSHKTFSSEKLPGQLLLEKKNKGLLVFDSCVSNIGEDFCNIPGLRTYLDQERKTVVKSLIDFEKKGLGENYENAFPLTGSVEQIYSSSKKNLLVGKIKFANIEDTKKAIETSLNYFNQGGYSQSSWPQRASILLRAASIMLVRRNELSALITYEAGKTLKESLADVDEAIDFLDFYAKEEARIQKSSDNLSSRGPFAVIAPWNFPLAIPCGMTAAALVAGNTVILKSAEQTPLIAQKLVDIFHEAGTPKDALIHLPGQGEIIGKMLVEDPSISGIVFTGSKSVGLQILKGAGTRIFEKNEHDTNIPVKVITEMGGKNAVIVLANAELDETVSGIIYSAFGHAGQKCSAASRIIVDERVKDRLVERLKEASNDLRVGEAYKFSTHINPLITEDDKIRIQNSVKEACNEADRFGGKVHLDLSCGDYPGHCVGPSIIELPTHRGFQKDSYSQKELFGPVLHVLPFKEIEDAVNLFNATEYALTGGIFGQSQDDIDFLLTKLKSGNIYVNRTITGARVAIEPFGGFKLSGTGPKAGGRNYLKSFHRTPLNLPLDYQNIKPSPVDELESSYQFELCRATKLPQEEYLPQFLKGLDKVIEGFDFLYHGIYGENKDILKSYRDFVRKDLLSFITKGHLNREIPGQLSYDDYQLKNDRVILLAFEQRAYFSTLLHFLSSLSLGLGVTILVKNEITKEWWQRLCSSFYGFGINKGQLDIFIPSDDYLEKILKETDSYTVLLDGDEEKLKNFLPKIYRMDNFNEGVKKLIGPLDSPNIKDFESYYMPFIYVRSLAINTMRHGAPLDLNFGDFL